MKSWFTVIFCALVLPCTGQYRPGAYDLQRIAECPMVVNVTPEQARDLPESVDNSLLPFFPGIINQAFFPTCQQVSGVYYTYCYEINRLRNLSSLDPANRYPEHYSWSLLNNGKDDGVSFWESYDLIREMGHMLMPDYGDTLNATLKWISGYDKYERAMGNRIKQIRVLKLTPDSGIQTLRRYLFDHLDGSSSGGIAVFTCATPFSFPALPAGTPEAGKPVALEFESNANHGITVVGYNDSIRFDINGDGQYTNNLDINGDGKLNDLDKEIGGFKLANSLDSTWQWYGYFYGMYSTMVKRYTEGGIWNECVLLIDPDPDYTPLLTMKVAISSRNRSRIGIRAGINPDTTQNYPTQEISYPAFHFQGGEHCFTGIDTAIADPPLEIALDITPLTGYMTPGSAARFFLIAEALPTGQNVAGEVSRFSLVDHTTMQEIGITTGNFPVWAGEKTLLSAIAGPMNDPVRITTSEVPPLQSQVQQMQLTASGGSPPYEWKLLRQVVRKVVADPFPPLSGTLISPIDPMRACKAVRLPFSFPFFGKQYDTLYVNHFGMATWEEISMPFPYLSDGIRMLQGIAAIAPAFSRNYWWTPGPAYGVWYDSTAEWALIRWKIPSDWYPQSSMNHFAMKLFPNGEIEFSYETMDITSNGWRLFSGISAGDGVNGLLEEVKDAHSLESGSYLYRTISGPPGISVSTGGLLTLGPVTGSQSSQITLQATDRRRISARKNYSIAGNMLVEGMVSTDHEPYLIPGRTTNLTLKITNRSGEPAENLRFLLRSPGGEVTFADSIAGPFSIQAGHLVMLDSLFSFQTVSDLTDGETVCLQILNADSATCIYYEMQAPVAAPVVEITAPAVNDGYDGFLDPGEVALLSLEVRNTGTSGLNNLTVLLSSPDPLISVEDEATRKLQNFGGKSCYPLTWKLVASAASPPGSLHPMQITVADGLDIIHTLSFEIQTGRYPAAIINLEPDTSNTTGLLAAMNELGVDVPVFNFLPDDLQPFQSLFVAMGIYGNLYQAEQHRLASYLREGGNLYLELYPMRWHLMKKQELMMMFRYTTATGPHKKVTAIRGTPEGFTSDMMFNIDDDQLYAKYLITPLSPGTSLFHDSDSTNKILCFAGDYGSHRVIGSSFHFYTLRDTLGPSVKTELMKRYLGFFDINFTGPYPLFHADTLILRPGHAVRFTDDSYSGIVSRQWTFHGGSPGVSSDSCPWVSYPLEGLYDVELEVSDGLHQKSLRKNGYIAVRGPVGLPGQEITQHFFLYPNPADGFVKVTGLPEGPVTVDIADATGRTLQRRQVLQRRSGEPITLPLTGLSPGIYLILMKSSTFATTGKLVVR